MDLKPEASTSGRIDPDLRVEILRRLRRIEGQVRGIQKMLEEGRDCEAIVLQVAALKAATVRVGTMIISAHLVDCLAAGEAEDPAGLSRLRERFMNIFRKLS